MSETKYETAERILVNNRNISEEDFSKLFLKEHAGTDWWVVDRYHREIKRWTKQHAKELEEYISENEHLFHQLTDFKEKEMLQKKLRDIQKKIDKDMESNE
jgi:cell division protein FtsB